MLLLPCVLQYYALQILETVIKTRWKILPRNQCEGKSFFCGKIPETFIPMVLVCFFLFSFFFVNVTCGCHVEEYSPTKHAGLFSARLTRTGYSERLDSAFEQ